MVFASPEAGRRWSRHGVLRPLSASAAMAALWSLLFVAMLQPSSAGGAVTGRRAEAVETEEASVDHGHGNEPHEHEHGHSPEHGSGHGHQHSHGHGHGHAHMDPADIDFKTACMLLGAFFTFVGLFELVNWWDDDIRRYTWKVVSMTINIFVSVLLYQAANHVLNEILMKLHMEEQHAVVCVIRYLHCFVYLIGMQIFTGVMSGTLLNQWGVSLCAAMATEDILYLDEEGWVVADAMLAANGRVRIPEEKVRNKTGKKSVYIDQHGSEVRVKKCYFHLENVRRKMRCWSSVLAHMGGFASINASCTMHVRYFKHCSPLMAFAPIAFNQILLRCFFVLTNYIRDEKARRAFRASQIREDPSAGIRHRLYDEEVTEAEMDVNSISLSFLLVLVCRSAIGGHEQHGEHGEEGLTENPHPTYFTIMVLYCVGFAFAGLSAMLAFALELVQVQKEEDTVQGDVRGLSLVAQTVSSLSDIRFIPTRNSSSLEGLEDEEEEEPFVVRLIKTLMDTTCMCFSWCTMFATRWLANRSHLDGWHRHEHGSIMATVLIASELSVVTFFVVLVLDKIDDAGDAEENPAKASAVQVAIHSLGTMVGFSWEAGFHHGIGAIVSMHEHPVMMKIFLAFLCVSILVPAWKEFILKSSIASETLKTERRAQKKKGVAKIRAASSRILRML